MTDYQVSCHKKCYEELSEIAPEAWQPSKDPDCLTARVSQLPNSLAAKLKKLLRSGRTVLWRKIQPIDAVIFDMDATLIRQETINVIAGQLGLEDAVAAITERAMLGQLDFATALQGRVALLKGLREERLFAVSKQLELSSGVRQLCQDLYKAQIPMYLVSGGFLTFAREFAKQLHFSGVRANELQIIDAHLTGQLSGPIICEQAKLQFVTELQKKHGYQQERLIVIGDGANDVPMLNYAGTGIGFRPKPIVYDHIQGVMQSTHATLIDFIHPPRT